MEIKEFYERLDVQTGEMLRQKRKDAGLSQGKLIDEIAEFLIRNGVNTDYGMIAISTLSNYENGSCKIPSSYVVLVEKVFESLKA